MIWFGVTSSNQPIVLYRQQFPLGTCHRQIIYSITDPDFHVITIIPNTLAKPLIHIILYLIHMYTNDTCHFILLIFADPTYFWRLKMKSARRTQSYCGTWENSRSMIFLPQKLSYFVGKYQYFILCTQAFLCYGFSCVYHWQYNCILVTRFVICSHYLLLKIKRCT